MLGTLMTACCTKRDCEAVSGSSPTARPAFGSARLAANAAAVVPKNARLDSRLDPAETDSASSPSSRPVAASGDILDSGSVGCVAAAVAAAAAAASGAIGAANLT